MYNAAIKDRAVTYAWFFLAYLIHIAFCVWSAIAPPLPGANAWSHTGFIACVRAFNASKFVGVVYTIGGVLWALESLWSLWVLKTVSAADAGNGDSVCLQNACSCGCCWFVRMQALKCCSLRLIQGCFRLQPLIQDRLATKKTPLSSVLDHCFKLTPVYI